MKLRSIWRGLVLAVAGAGAVGATLYGCERNERRVVAELDRLSQGGAPEYFGLYDYVCVNHEIGLPWAEFAEAAASKSIHIANCGIGSSCCNVGSDLGGIIGLVKDGAIRCVELKGTVVLLDSARPFCAKPSNLIVKRETIVEAGRLIPGRSMRSRPGETYYKLMEKRP